MLFISSKLPNLRPALLTTSSLVSPIRRIPLANMSTHSSNTNEKSFQVPDSPRMRPFGGPSVWLEFTPLSRLTSSINLGQGAPGWGSPSFVKEALAKSVQSDEYSQYAPPGGAPSLVNEILSYYSPRLRPSDASSDTETETNELDTIVTNGASQAISLACLSLLGEGDQVILFEPAFDIYTGAVVSAGATPVYVPLRLRRHNASTSDLRSSDIEIDFDAFENALNENTRMVFLNSPHNPTGKVFTYDELARLSAIIDKHAPTNCVVLSDEVYEHLVYDDTTHVPFASISKNAYNRTLSVYSAGKTLSATGLKVGWAVGLPSLIKPLRLLQQFVVFAVCHHAQVAIAESLRVARENGYFKTLKEDYKRKKDILVTGLEKAGFKPMIPDGAFFVCALVPDEHDARRGIDMPNEVRKLVTQQKLVIDEQTTHRIDYNICRNLVVKYGVTAIPNSAFFTPEHVGTSALSQCIIRFAFCHPDDVLKKAMERLKQPQKLHN